MLTARLRDHNLALHALAERRSAAASLLSGTMPRARYIAMLGQQYLRHRALDDALSDARARDPRLRALVLDEHKLTRYLVEDLESLGVALGSIVPSPDTRRYLDHLESRRDEPLHLLGLHYVRLGACNGNRVVARAVREAYALGDLECTRYLDPFTDQQRDQWAAFKAALDATPLSDAEQDAVLEGSRAAYLHAIGTASAPPRPAAGAQPDAR